MKPFVEVALAEQNSIQKILKVSPSGNVIKELNNYLANRDYGEVTRNDIEEIGKKYKCDLIKKYPKDIEGIYRGFLEYHLGTPLPNDGTNYMREFADILGIEKTTAEKIIIEIGSRVYESKYENAIYDRRLTQEQENELEELQKFLSLPEAVAEDISVEQRKKVIQGYIDKIISDGEISPDEDEELRESAKSLKVSMVLDEKTQNTFNKLRKIWSINHEDLPILMTDIHLQKNEYCYYTSGADWYETRVVRSKAQYAGPSYSIKIMKGVRYRVGSINYSTSSSEELTKIDTGTIYLTNKRIIFTGAKKNNSLNYSKVLSIQPYKNGVDIIKDSGKNPFISVTQDLDMFIAILTRVIADS